MLKVHAASHSGRFRNLEGSATGACSAPENFWGAMPTSGHGLK